MYCFTIMIMLIPILVHALCSSNACVCAMLFGWGGRVLLLQYNNNIWLNISLLIVSIKPCYSCHCNSRYTYCMMPSPPNTHSQVP